MSAEAVRVIVRCRPMNQREKGLNCKNVVKIDNKIGQCALVNPGDPKAVQKSFTFDGAYDTDSTTDQIYADIGYPLVEGVTEGYNGTIFAYGQTGCGKSFSMQGITDPASQRGIIPRAFDHIFETITVSEGSKYLVHASYLEIYNEEIRDLLGKDVKQKLELKEHPDKGVYVQTLSMHPCKNVHDCQKVMDQGWKNRATGSTLMNADSSRSHSIFSIHLERCESDESGEEHIRAAKLNLVDLAGSERQAKTGATGDRLKEATKINLSLSALGNVISALVDGKSKHIPYRDSKLTRLLQDSLGGNTKTLMVACLSPADNNYDETLSTLRYANRAKNIKNKPKINEDPKDALLREYQEEIEKLRAMLRGEIPANLDAAGGSAAPVKAKGKVHTAAPPQSAETSEAVEAEKARIREEYEDKMTRMNEDFEEMKISKTKLEEEMARLQEGYTADLANVDHLSHIPSPGQRPTIANGEALVNGNEEYMGGEEDDIEFTQTPRQSHAVHVATVVQEGVTAPRSSPTGESNLTQVQHDEALRRVSKPGEAMLRLQELQQVMVGGEEANNEEKKEKRKRKKKYAEERKKKLQEELAKMNGEDIMLGIFDNIHDELKMKDKILMKEKEKNEGFRQEVLDLQSEFEFERIDYLDTIRKQEQQMKWLQSVIDKIHPCLRRDCNYMNLDRVKIQSQWDPETQSWNLPKMTVEKHKLPPTVGILAPNESQKAVNGEMSASVYDDLRSEDRYLQKLHQSAEQDAANSYFKNKRAEKLLNKRNVQGTSPVNSTSNGYGSGGSGRASPAVPAAPWQVEPMSHDQLRAAQVHGQISGDDFGPRKPQRLEALAPVGSKSGKRRKSRQQNEGYY